MKLEVIDEIKVGQKVWILENNELDELLYPGIVKAIEKNSIIVYKYALGIYHVIHVNINNLYKRYENISHDIFINTEQIYVNRKRH